jgi:hypothetical protein
MNGWICGNVVRCSAEVRRSRELTYREEFAVRKIGDALSASVLVVLLGATILIATFDVNKYRGALQNELRKGLGRPVKLGDVHLKLFPPRFAVEELVIGRA